MEALKPIGDWLLSNGGILTACIAGIFSWYSDGKKNKVWHYLVIAGVIVGAIWAFLSANYADVKQRAESDRVMQQVENYMAQQASDIKSDNRAALNEALQKLLGLNLERAKSLTPEQATAIVDGGSSARNLIQKLPSNSNQSLSIHLFPHLQQEVDFGVVTARLKTMAANVEEYGPRESASPTNSVWYGPGVSLEQAKAAALTVASAGVQIRQICDKPEIKTSNLIQIGGSVRAVNQDMPILQLSEIQTLNSPKCEK